MRKVSIWGREMALQGSPLTLLIYRQEFGGDLLEAIAETQDGERVFIEPLLRVAWSMARTADENVSPYLEWLDQFPDEEFDLLHPPVEVIVSAINAELFRIRPTGLGAKIREAIARLLERLAKRARP